MLFGCVVMSLGCGQDSAGVPDAGGGSRPSAGAAANQSTAGRNSSAGAAGVPNEGSTGAAGTRARDAGHVDFDAASGDAASGDASHDDGMPASDAAIDAGSERDAAREDAGHDAGASGMPTIVAVGYAGLRVSSYDLGRSWHNKKTLSDVAADDPDNLRGATYGAGLFVAVGHKIFTSVDGNVWDPRSHPQSGQWLGDVKYGNGRFVATGGYGYSAWSIDGASWEQGGAIKTEASRSLAFGNGMFVSQTDAGNWYSSSDGMAWTLLSGGHDGPVAFCDGDFRAADDCDAEPFHGAYVRAGGWSSGVIAWSDDGSAWHDVQVGYVGGINAFAFGLTQD